jgi:hypothetical protein
MLLLSRFLRIAFSASVDAFVTVFQRHNGEAPGRYP